MRGVFFLLVAALVLSPVMAGNMGPDQKPQWAVGDDGDTSKNIVSVAPKSLKEATSYLYFDDMPSGATATLGKVEAPAKKVEVAAKKVEAPKKLVEEQAAKKAVLEPVDTNAGRLGAEKSSSEEKVVEKISSSSSQFTEGFNAKFQEFFTAAEPHQTTILSGLGVAGVVAVAVVLQRRRRRRHMRESELSVDVKGVAADSEFAPLLIAKKSSATGRGYGAM